VVGCGSSAQLRSNTGKTGANAVGEGSAVQAEGKEAQDGNVASPSTTDKPKDTSVSTKPKTNLEIAADLERQEDQAHPNRVKPTGVDLGVTVKPAKPSVTDANSFSDGRNNSIPIQHSYLLGTEDADIDTCGCRKSNAVYPQYGVLELVAQKISFEFNVAEADSTVTIQAQDIRNFSGAINAKILAADGSEVATFLLTPESPKKRGATSAAGSHELWPLFEIKLAAGTYHLTFEQADWQKKLGNIERTVKALDVMIGSVKFMADKPISPGPVVAIE
jgi:hypothetical protein